MSMDERKLRATTVGLAAFRVFLGLMMIALPWIAGQGLDGYGATCVGCGVAIVAAATQMHRAPWLRWVQASLSMAVFFLPFAFAWDDITAGEIYSATPVGMMLLMSSIVTPQLFAADENERTSDSDSSRSEASNSSSVKTPPN